MAEKKRKDELAEKVREQQDTGNHERPGAGGSDRFGGTREGAVNVEEKSR